MAQWECFSKGLPTSIITDLDYDPCSKYLYASTRGRSIYKTLVPFDDNTSTTLPSNSTIMWDKPVQLANNLIIPANTKLTITSTVYMAQNKKIIVHPSGTLIVNGGKITNQCGDMWQGIEVWGAIKQSQLAGAQGSVEIKNNGIISNAICGVRLVKMNGELPDLNSTGGIIICNNAQFINNKIAVSFYPYRNFNPITFRETSNLSSFKNTQFFTNDSYLLPIGNPKTFVNLNGVKSIPFRGCSFINSTTTTTTLDNRGTGITAYASAFWVDQLCTSTALPCTVFQKSKFEGLFYGIYATGDGDAYYLNIDHSEFINNLRGIYIGGINLASINRNSFITRAGTAALPASGIYLDYCTGYSVQENSFIGHFIVGESTSSTYETGILLNNSGESNNLVYNNGRIQSMQYGIIAQNKNRNSTGLNGLTIKCNDFISPNLYDIAITKSDPNSTLMGINKFQGVNGINTSDPAGNTFSYSWKAPESDYMNQCENLIYIYHSVPNGANVKPIQFSPSPKVSPTPSSYNLPYAKNSSCPSQLSSGGSASNSKTDLLNAEAKINAASNQLTLLEDGGDTEGLITEVQTSVPSDALLLRNELLLKSPYLSDTVMMETANKEDVLPAAMVTEVLVANPQAAKSEVVAQALDSRENQLSEDQRNAIDQGVFVLGAKESLESKLAQYNADRSNAQYQLLRYYLSDTLITSSDSIKVALIAQPDLWAKYMLSLQQVLSGDSLAADAILQSILSSNNLTSEEQSQLSSYIDYANVQKQLVAAGSNAPDSLQELLLKAIASDTLCQPSAYARALLVNAGRLEYSEPYIFPVDGYKSAKVIAKKQIIFTDENTLKIYPNPAKDYIIAEYMLKDGVSKAKIEICDISGKPIKSVSLTGKHDYLVIPLNDCAPGAFLCRLSVKNKIVGSVKFTVTQ